MNESSERRLTVDGKSILRGSIRQIDLDARTGRFLADSGNIHPFRYAAEIDDDMKAAFQKHRCELQWRSYDVKTGMLVVSVRY